jgi:flagellar biosynthesis/type III secretory pathway protein FliH
MTQPLILEQLQVRGDVVGAGVGPADRAAEIVAKAQARATEIEAQARENGIEIGRQEGRAEAEVEVAHLGAALRAAVQAVESSRDELVATIEMHAVDLAVTIAGKIVGASLAADPSLVCEVVAGALRRIVERDRVVLELNPEDVELVRTWLGGSGSEWGRVEIHPERRVPRGGCVARTGETEIDARPAEQLARAEQLLRQAFAERRR